MLPRRSNHVSWRSSSGPLKTRTPLVEAEKKAPSRNEPTGSATRTASPESCSRPASKGCANSVDPGQRAGGRCPTRRRGHRLHQSPWSGRDGRSAPRAWHRAPARRRRSSPVHFSKRSSKENAGRQAERKAGRERSLLGTESSCVTTDAGPPEAAHRMRPPFGFPTMITSSRFHAPPTASRGRSHTFCGAPPLTSIFLSCPAASNAMNRLSGDQNRDGVRPPRATSDPDNRLCC